MSASAPDEENEDFDFEEALRSIHIDLQSLNEEASKLAARIAPALRGVGRVNTWQATTLGAVCSLITDGKHGDCTDEENSDYYFISAKDIRDGIINYESARQISENDFAETHRRTDLKPGDLLVTNSGTIGRLAIAQDDQRTFRTTFSKKCRNLKAEIV